MALTLYGRNHHSGQVYGDGDPVTLWMALMEEAPTDIDTGTDLDEPTGASYARVDIPNDNTGFYEPADGEIVNAMDIIFPTSEENWGTMRFWALIDASTGGNIVIWGFLGAVDMTTGRTLRVPIGSLVIGVRGDNEVEPAEWADEEVV